MFFVLFAMSLLSFNPFPNKPWFKRLHNKFFQNIVEKEEIACNKQFLLFPKCFLQILGTFCHFFFIYEIVVCKLFQFGRV